MQPRFIVGLDPSLSCTGICIYNVRTKKVTVLSVKTKKDNFPNPEARAQHIANTIFAKVQEYCRPDDSHIGVERLISHRTTRSQSQLQALFGMLWYVFSQNNYPVYAVAPSEVKKSFTVRSDY
jgi:Holliday junction resolvasome RuvABC endonuclease subunit